MTDSLVNAFRPGGKLLASAALLALAPAPALAQDFALALSPPRFELSAKPGETVRAVAEISNRSDGSSDLTFATAEWELTPEGGVVLSEALKQGSCRPWVAIERRQTVLPGRAQLRYRFEVTPPPGTPATECRFAIVISGGDRQVSPAENVAFPVSGQIALIVYVAVGDVRPALQITKADVVELNGTPTPVIMVENTGTAHGRLAAFLSGTDAAGIKREFSPQTLPILPGETRMIALTPDVAGDAIEAQVEGARDDAVARPIVFPLSMSGTINDGINSFRFEGVFEP
jgi:hypothetical protein